MTKRTTVLALLVVPVLGCGSADVGEGGSLATAEEALAPATPKWPSKLIPICYNPPLVSVSTDMLDWIRSAAVNSWGRLGDIRFLWVGPCAGNEPDTTIHLAFQSGCVGEMGDTSQIGFRSGSGNVANFCTTFQPTGSTTFITADHDRTTMTAIHEIGHLLGYSHETSLPSIMSNNANTLSVILHSGNVFPTPTDVVQFQRDYGRKPANTMVTVGNNCMDVQNDNWAPQTPVWSWSCNDGPAQVWTYSNNVFFAQQGAPTTNVLEVPFTVFGFGSVVQTNVLTGSPFQAFAFTDTAVVGPGNLCLERSQGSMANGTSVILNVCNASAAQKWHYRPGAISTTDNTKCLDAGGPGGQLRIWDCVNGDPFQQINAAAGHRMVAASAGRPCLSATAAVNAVPTFGACSGDLADPLFQFFLQGGVHLAGSTNLCLEVINGSLDLGAGMHLAACSGGLAQRFDYYPG